MYGFCRPSAQGSATGFRRVTEKATRKTTLQPCQMDWGRWSSTPVSVDGGGCGCLLCSYSQTCNRSGCGERTKPDFVAACNVPCRELTPFCDQNNKIQWSNNSRFSIYAVLRDNENLTRSYFLLDPERGGMGAFEKSSSSSTWMSNIIGNLQDPDFLFQTFAGNQFDDRFGLNMSNKWIRSKSLFGPTKSCLGVQFLDAPQLVCPAPLGSALSDEQKLLDPVQAELDTFLDKMNLVAVTNFLDGATIRFTDPKLSEDPPSKHYIGDQAVQWEGENLWYWAFKLDSKVESLANFVLKSRDTPVPGCFHLKMPNGQYAICGTKDDAGQNSTNIYVLTQSKRVNPKQRIAKKLQRTISFLPIKLDGGIVGFGWLPFQNSGSPGLDGVTMIIDELPAQNGFLQASAAAKAVCCNPTAQYAYATKAFCKGSKYDQDQGSYTADCDAFMREEWCVASSATPGREQTCSCFPGFTPSNPVQAAILKWAEEKKEILPHRCIVDQCRLGYGYLTADMKQAVCPPLCIQIQQAINNGDLGNINFGGGQKMVCSACNPQQTQCTDQTSELQPPKKG